VVSYQQSDQRCMEASVSFCHRWRQNMTKGIKRVEAHSKVLSKKVMHGRIPMDFPKPLLVSRIYPDSRMIRRWRRTLWCLCKINIMFERTALEICVVCIRRKRDCLSREWRERKRKQRKRIENITTDWTGSPKSAILLVYLMTSIQFNPLHNPFQCGRS